MAIALWVTGGIVKAQPRPDVTAWVPSDTVQAGVPFTLNVTANTPAHRAVAFPAADADSAVFGPLTVLRRSAVYNRHVGVMYAIDSVAYTVKTEASDSVRVPPIPVRVDAALDTVETHTQPFTVPVAAGGGAPMVSSIEDLPPPVWTWSVIGIVLIAALGGAYLWGRDVGAKPSETESTAPTVTVDSRKNVQHRLRRLEAWEVDEPEAVETFYVALADTVEAYLRRRLNVKTSGRTTGELKNMLDHAESVPPAAASRVQAVLEEADLVKFARKRPDPTTAKAALRDAHAAVEAIESAAAAEQGTD